MNTHPLLLKTTSVLAALALVASLFGFALSASVQQAQAATMAEQIICYVDQQLGPDLPFNPQNDYCNSGEPTEPGPLPQCLDTIDNDNDGVKDLADPDCDSANDNTESGSMGTSTGTTTPPMQCADTIDNDSDGVTDLADPDCDSSSDNTESGTMGTSTGTTTNPGDDEATLWIVKNSVGGNGTFAFSVNGGASSSLTTTNGWATSSAMTIDAGTTTVSEGALSGWNTTGISCMRGTQSVGSTTGSGMQSFVAADDDQIICTFINTATSTGTTTDAALHVDSIDAQKTSGIANDTYEDGWRYLFHITAPNDEENLSMRFSDWVSANSTTTTISVANNMRVSSAQASSTAAVTLTAANAYSTPPMIMTTDLDPLMPGRQVEVLVELKIPSGTANESYTTTYGVRTLP